MLESECFKNILRIFLSTCIVRLLYEVNTVSELCVIPLKPLCSILIGTKQTVLGA